MKNVQPGERARFTATIVADANYGAMKGGALLLTNLKKGVLFVRSHTFIPHYELRRFERFAKNVKVSFDATVQEYPGLDENGNVVVKFGLIKIRNIEEA